MARVGLIMALVAFIAVALTTLIPLVGSFLVAPLTALLVGAGAGWWASKVLGYGTAGRGAGAGAIAGIGALLGSVIGLVVLGAILGNSAEFQRNFQQGIEEARQQNPGAAVPNINARTIAAAGGGVAGFCFGLVDLFLSTIGGLIAGLIYGRNRGPQATTPVGSYSIPETHLPQATNLPGTTSGHDARIYPDEQRHD